MERTSLTSITLRRAPENAAVTGLATRTSTASATKATLGRCATCRGARTIATTAVFALPRNASAILRIMALLVNTFAARQTATEMGIASKENACARMHGQALTAVHLSLAAGPKRLAFIRCPPKQPLGRSTSARRLQRCESSTSTTARATATTAGTATTARATASLATAGRLASTYARMSALTRAIARRAHAVLRRLPWRGL
jgi:hypothetical protein